MKLIYLSNFFNHHQRFLSNEFFETTDGQYLFVETGTLPEDRKNLGYKKYDDPYVVQYNEGTKQYLDQVIYDAEVVICGEAPVNLVKARINAGKLTFRDDESRYKSLIKYLKWPIYTKNSWYFNKCYLLCASAFGCRDYHMSGMSINKCYRWGYFPEVKLYENIEVLLDLKDSGLKHCQNVSILWVGRLIGLKHPELAVKLARRLKEDNIQFKFDMIGIGNMQSELEKMIKDYDLEENVKMLGSMSPTQVREYMEKAHIFLFTSDRGEGWGAVLNESMNSACAVVASPVIGASPYLIEEGKTGLFFKDQSVDSLYDKVLWLINHPSERRAMGKAAYESIRGTWSAKTAVNNFFILVESLQNGGDSMIIEGPCSKAPYLKRNWYK